MERDDIDSDVTVAQVLKLRPAAAIVFVRRGMACVGCSMAPFETLSDVAAVYGQEPGGFLAELDSTGRGGSPRGARPGPDTARSRPARRDNR